jgi:hypothetical protein
LAKLAATSVGLPHPARRDRVRGGCRGFFLLGFGEAGLARQEGSARGEVTRALAHAMVARGLTEETYRVQRRDMATAKEQRVQFPAQHPDDADPVTWLQIDRDRADYHAGNRGHSLEEMRARHPRPETEIR